MKRLLTLTIVPLFLFVTLPLAQAQEIPLNVVATTTIIADVAQHVGGDRISVTALVPRDADEHAWQPTPQDAARVAQADLLLVNGAGLEAFLGGLLENAGQVQPVVVSIGIAVLPYGGHGHDSEAEHGGDHEHLGLLGVDIDCGDAHSHESEEAGHADDEHAGDEAGHNDGECDPHFWTDPTNVMVWADNIAAAFSAADPAGADLYAANAAAYREQLAALDAEIETIVATVPDARRVLVTNHEFLGYFAHRYGFQVVGVVLGATTLSEPSPQEVAALASVIRDEGVPALFAEVTNASGLSAAVAAEAGDITIARLYSGSLSAADGPAATYIDYMRYNTQTIADALGG